MSLMYAKKCFFLRLILEVPRNTFFAILPSLFSLFLLHFKNFCLSLPSESG